MHLNLYDHLDRASYCFMFFFLVSMPLTYFLFLSPICQFRNWKALDTKPLYEEISYKVISTKQKKRVSNKKSFTNPIKYHNSLNKNQSLIATFVVR